MQRLFFPLGMEGAVVWDGAQHRGLALFLLSSPHFWEVQVLPQGLLNNVKKDGEDWEGSCLISSKATGVLLFFFLLRGGGPKHSRSKIKPQGAGELGFKHKDSS